MNKKYKIEIITSPFKHTARSPHTPYFWCIRKYVNEEWAIHKTGWASSPNAAWRSASKYLKSLGVVA